MSDNDFDEFFVHTASVEKWLGTRSNGDIFAAPVTIACFADDSRKLVRDKDKQQVISETTLYTSITNAALFVAKSRVTVLGDSDSDDPAGRAAFVIKVNVNDSGALDLPDHVAVSLT
jgi:hypothetical protein